MRRGKEKSKEVEKGRGGKGKRWEREEVGKGRGGKGKRWKREEVEKGRGGKGKWVRGVKEGEESEEGNIGGECLI